jgi:hypothetical protein
MDELFNWIFRWTSSPEFVESLSVTAAVIGALSGLVSWLQIKGRAKPPSLQDRIHRLTSSLEEAVSVISEMQREIAQGQELADKLKQDAEVAERIVNLHSDEVEAVVQALGGQRKEEERRSFWKNLGWNTFFMVAGVALGEFVRFWTGPG